MYPDRTRKGFGVFVMQCCFGSQNTMYDVDIMMIGHFAKDRLMVDSTTEIASGGAVYYGSIALRRIGAHVAVVTRLHSDDFPFLNEMEAESVQVFATPAPETSGIENIYITADMERRICKPLGFAGPFSPQEIPDLRARIYLVAPIMAGEVGLSLLKSLAQRGPIALDVQGFVRVREGEELVFRDWPEKAEGLAMVTYLKLDHAEAKVLTGLTEIHAAARQIAAYGPREIMITHNGGVLVYAGEQAHEATFAPRSMDGRTGRGDTCFATYLGRRLSAPPGEACRFAAAVTTLKMERPGPFRGTLAEVEAMMARQSPPPES
jgi:sugar/nucleoside kinase (ribokinase family)